MRSRKICPGPRCGFRRATINDILVEADQTYIDGPIPPILAFRDVFWRKLFDSRIPMTLRAQDKPMVTPTLQTPLFLVEVSIRGAASLFPGINYINMCSYKSCVYSVSVYEPDLGRWLFGNSKSTMMDVAEGNSSAVRI